MASCGSAHSHYQRIHLWEPPSSQPAKLPIGAATVEEEDSMMRSGGEGLRWWWWREREREEMEGVGERRREGNEDKDE